MAKWTFEPGHTAAEFSVRHMMVTHVRGHIKDVHGNLNFDPKNPAGSSVEVVMDARKIWTGEEARDAHLRSADFLDVENFPEIRFYGNEVTVIGEVDGKVNGNLTIRGVTRPVTLDVHYLGQWLTPWWEDGVDKGPRRRAGFVVKATINRHDFGVSWNDKMDNGGIVVSDNVEITIDAEAILEASES
jgi:polyisoprenoid-binding protein YceI